MRLLAVNIDAGRHYIYTCDGVCYTLSALSENLYGDRDYIHDRVGVSVVIAWFDDFNIYMVDHFTVLFGQSRKTVVVDRHLSACRDLVLVAHLDFCHVERFDDKSSQFNIICSHCYSDLSFLMSFNDT